MRLLLGLSAVILLSSVYCIGQEPVPVVAAKWERAVVRAPKSGPVQSGPQRTMTPQDKYFQRKAREGRTDNPMDPYESSIEGRSAAMDRAVQEARAVKTDDQTGYSYLAEVRNDSGRNIDVIYWEYRFTEIARPTNVVRRQFLCGVNLKKGGRQELLAFSLLGPSEVIDAASLASATEKVFSEEVLVNQIEFSDGAIMQRVGWNFNDVKEAVKRATSTPWGRETCRGL